MVNIQHFHWIYKCSSVAEYHINCLCTELSSLLCIQSSWWYIKGMINGYQDEILNMLHVYWWNRLIFMTHLLLMINLKNDANRIFITENLTKTRTNLVKSLADLKYNQNIKTYWTTDGRVYAKLNESSRRTLIRNHDDIRNLLNASDYDIN